MRRSHRRRRRLIAAAVVLLAVPAVFGLVMWMQDASQQRNVEDARAAGMLAYERGNFEEVLPHLSYVVSRDPSDVEALLAFAHARSNVPLENNRHLFESIGLLLAALQHEPQNLTALERLLALYERTGRRLEWLGTADRILAIDPDHTEALRLKAVGHTLISEFEVALRYTERLIETQPEELRWRMFHLQINRDRGQPNREMLALCDQWIVEAQTRSEEIDGRFHMLKASFLANIGEREEAQAAALEAAEHGATSSEVLQRLVSLLDGMQLRDQATELILQTKEQFPHRQWPHEADIRRLWQAARIDEALARIELVQQAHGDLNSGMLRWQSLLHIQQNEPNRAQQSLAELERRIAVEPSSHDVNRAWIEAIRARIDLDNANWNEALDKYRNALAQDPGDAVLHFLVGEAYQLAGEKELAASSFERAVRADPNWISAQIAYTESLLSIGRSETAARTAVSILRRAAEPPLDLYLLLARAWMASGLSGEDLGVRGPGGTRLDPPTLLRMLREQAGDHPPLTELLVHALLEEGNDESASEVIEESLTAKDSHPESMIRLARTSHSANLGFERRLIERAMERIGLTVEVAEIKARVLHQEGQTAEGRELLERAVAEHPQGSLDRDLGMRALVTYLVVTEQPDAKDVLAQILESAAGNPEQIAFVLAQPLVWTDQELTRRAVTLLTDALGDSSLRVSLARATYILHFKRDDPAAMADALVIVNDVLHRTPDSLGARTLMAALHLASRPPDSGAAIRQLQRAVRDHPRRADLYPQLIALLQQQGDFATAEAHLNRLSSLTGRSERLRQTEIQLLEKQGDFQSIISLLGDRLASAASGADRVMLLTSYHRAGKREQAEQVAQTLLSHPEPSAAALGAIAQFYADTGRYHEGLELLTDFEARDPAAAALLLGAFHQYTGRQNKSERWLLRAVERAPDNPRAWNLLADHYLRIGEAREARQAARSGLDIAPDDYELQSKLVLATLSMGAEARHDQRELRQLIESIGRESAAMAATLEVFARIAAREGGRLTQRDLTDTARLVRDHGGFLPAWRLAIAAHAQAGDFESAADLAGRASTRFPTDPEPVELATRILIDLNRPTEALEMARTWRSRSLDRTFLPDAVIASLLVDLGRAKAAIEQLKPHEERIIAERAETAEHMRTWLSALVMAGEIDRAINAVRPMHEEGESHWVQALAELAGRASARESARLLERLESLLENDGAGTLMLAAQWAQLARRTEQSTHLERAESLAMRAIDIDPANELNTHLLRATIEDFRGNPKSAEEHYRHVLASDPNSVMALNNLADILVRSGGSSDEAVALSERALAILPDHPDLLDTHAQALLAAGMPEKAEPLAGRALAQRPDDAVALLTLTKVLLAQNRLEEANRTLQRASAVMSTSEAVSTMLKSKYNEVERALLAAHLPPGT